jgi:hypothetical protein
MMSDLDTPFGYRTIDYVVFPALQQIQHQRTGVCFRFDRGRKLSRLGPEASSSDPEAIMVERGARAVLDQWPQGSILW